MSEIAARVPEMIAIPTGAFVMGAGEDDKFASVLELPRHTVTLTHPFALAATPVTFAQWDAYAAATGAWSPPDYGVGRDEHPVASVSWNDVQAWLAWLRTETGESYRLPTEAEWEYACRAGSATAFHTGDDLPLEAANYWYAEDGRKIGPGRPRPVGSYPPNAFGLHDMHGTICELVQDSWHDGYANLPADGSSYENPAEPHVVCRGGAWDYAARLLRAAFRDWVGRDERLDNVGFRLALDLQSGQ